MLQRTRTDPGSFFGNQMLRAATGSAKRIVVGGLITPIARSVGIKPNHDDKMLSSERLALTTFEQMKFCAIEGGRIC